MRLTPGNATIYKEKHDQIWPELLEVLNDHLRIRHCYVILPITNLQSFLIWKLTGGKLRAISVDLAARNVR